MEPERRLIPLSAVKPKPISWLWRHRIPRGKITILEGHPGQAKSTLTLDLAARCTRGCPMPNCQETTKPAGVVMLQGEDGLEDTLLPGLLAAGADTDRVQAYDRIRFQGAPLVLPDDLRFLATAVANVRAALVVIDGVTDFFSVNVNHGQSVRRALAALAAFAEQTNTAILLVRHLTKSGSGKNPLHHGVGSIALTAAARSVLQAAPDPCSDDVHQHVLLSVKSNLSEAGGLVYRSVLKGGEKVIEWMGEASGSPQQLVAASQEEKSALMEAAYVLYSILAEGPVWAGDVLKIATRATISPRTLKRAKALLRVRSRKRGIGMQSKWFWELPQDEALLRHLKDQDLGDLMDQLIYGDQDPPPPGNQRKERRSDDLDPGGQDDQDDEGGDGQLQS